MKRFLSLLLALLICLIPLAVPAEEAGTVSEDYDPLWKLAEPYGFKLGGAFSAQDMNNPTFMDFLARHFNSLTCCNETKAYGNLGAVNASNQKFIIENGAILQTTATVETGTPIRVRTPEGGVINNSADFIADQAITGTRLEKRGSGTLLCFVANTALDTLVINAGAVAQRNGNAAKAIILQNGTLWDDSQSTTHAIVVPKGKSGTWQLTNANYTNYANKLTGEGTITIVPRNSVNRVRISGDWSKFQGTVKHTNSKIWLPFDCTSGMPHGTLDIAAGCGVTNVAKTMTIGAEQESLQLMGKPTLGRSDFVPK